AARGEATAEGRTRLRAYTPGWTPTAAAGLIGRLGTADTTVRARERCADDRGCPAFVHRPSIDIPRSPKSSASSASWTSVARRRRPPAPGSRIPAPGSWFPATAKAHARTLDARRSGGAPDAALGRRQTPRNDGASASRLLRSDCSSYFRHVRHDTHR